LMFHYGSKNRGRRESRKPGPLFSIGLRLIL
jgi:hypothetical protein